MTIQADRVVAQVRRYVGCSLDNRKADLGDLVSRGVDDPAKAVEWHTNCGTFALGILWALGVEHPLLARPYVNGAALAWIIQIGRELGVLRRYLGTSQLSPGLLCYYAIPPSNEHVEFLTTLPDSLGIAYHAGGGRPRNAITEGYGGVTTSSGRPLVFVLDVPQAIGASAAPPVLRRGATGESVKRLQATLVKAGWLVTIDGVFGVKTLAAVVGFQMARLLAADGIVGPLTWAALES